MRRTSLPLAVALSVAGAALATVLPGSAARANFTDDFTYAAGNATTTLPQLPYTFTTGSTNTSTQGTATTDGSTSLVINAGVSSGVFGGAVPSVTVDPASVGSTWTISTAVSFNWGSLTSASSLYPDGGLVIDSGTASEFDFHVKRQVNATGSGSMDYFEMTYKNATGSISDTNFSSDFSGRVANGGGTSYTLTISKAANGNILFQYLGTGFNGGVTGTAATLTPTSFTGGTGFSNSMSASDAASLYTFLNGIGSKQVGLFTDRQNEPQNSYAMSVDSLSLTGLNVISSAAPEPCSLAFVLAPGLLAVAGAARRRRRS